MQKLCRYIDLILSMCAIVLEWSNDLSSIYYFLLMWNFYCSRAFVQFFSWYLKILNFNDNNYNMNCNFQCTYRILYILFSLLIIITTYLTLFNWYFKCSKKFVVLHLIFFYIFILQKLRFSYNYCFVVSKNPFV